MKKDTFRILNKDLTMLTDNSNQHYVSVDNLASAIGFNKNQFIARADKYGAELIMASGMDKPESFIRTDKVSGLLFSIEARDLGNDTIGKQLVQFQSFGTAAISTWKPKKDHVYSNLEVVEYLKEQEAI